MKLRSAIGGIFYLLLSLELESFRILLAFSIGERIDASNLFRILYKILLTQIELI